MQQLPAAGSAKGVPVLQAPRALPQTTGYFEVRHHLSKCLPTPSTTPGNRDPCAHWGWKLCWASPVSTRGGCSTREREVVGVESVQQEIEDAEGFSVSG